MIYLTETQHKIVDFLLKNSEASVADIQKELGLKSRNTIYWHIERLKELGVLQPPKIKKTPWKVKADDVR